MADFTFVCPFCNLELSVDESNAGSEVECPGCNEVLLIPTPSQAAGLDDGGLPSGALGSAEIIKPKARPLEIAAKLSKALTIKTFRHHDHVKDGKDTFDADVSKFIGSLIEDDIVSINPIQYSHVEKSKTDPNVERVVAQYGIMVVYKDA